MIFALYVEGKSSADIAVELNKREVKSPCKVRWGSTTVLQLLKRKRYCGVKDKDGNLIVPPIIDEETFSKVEKVLAKNMKRGRGEKPTHIVPLRKQIECGGCGATLKYQKFYNKKGDWVGHRFYCPNHFPSKVEKGVFLQEEKVEYIKCPVFLDSVDIIDYVWEKVFPILTEPDRLRKAIVKYLDSCLIDKVEIELALTEKRKNFNKIEARWARARLQWRKEEIEDNEYATEKRLYDEQKVCLEEEISSLSDKLTVDDKINARVEEIEKALPFFKSELENIDWEKKAWWLNLLLDRVYLSDIGDFEHYTVRICGSLDRILDGWILYFKDNKNYTGEFLLKLNRIS